MDSLTTAPAAAAPATSAASPAAPSPSAPFHGETPAAAAQLLLSRPGMRETLAELTRVDGARFLTDLGLNWLWIVGAATLALATGHWFAWMLAIAIIATRQHALGVLMHDGTHHRVLPSRSLSDAVCDLFCALPVGMLTSRYRHEHLQHHRSPNTDDDPYWGEFRRDDTWHWPKPPGQAAWVFARDLLALNSPKWGRVQWRWSPWINHFKRTQPKGPPALTPSERLRTYAFHTVVLGALAVTGAWLEFALLWLLPLMTITPAMVRLRTIAEHLVLPGRERIDASRHTDGTWLERLSIAPHNINVHIAHHLFPAVPYYRLPELHAALMNDPRYAEHAIVNRSYFGFGPGQLLGEIVRRG